MKRIILIILLIGVGVLNSKDKKGWLGVYVEDIPEHYKVALDIEYGVIVTKVEEDSPADKVGIKEGDIILKIKDEKIIDTDDLTYYVKKHPNEEVNLEILRKNKKISLKVKIGEREPYKFEIEKRVILSHKENLRELIKNLRELIKELEKRTKEVEEKTE
ncbi:MAG: PDZ domain-containing protein [Candidatus Hydrothermales bacterium]